MNRPKNLKVGDKFRVVSLETDISGAAIGDILTLKKDDGSDNPFFINDKDGETVVTFFSNLDPFNDFNNARVGDIIVNEIGGEAKVLEVGWDCFHPSLFGDFSIGVNWYSFSHAKKHGWKLKDSKKSELLKKAQELIDKAEELKKQAEDI